MELFYLQDSLYVSLLTAEDAEGLPVLWFNSLGQPAQDREIVDCCRVRAERGLEAPRTGFILSL